MDIKEIETILKACIVSRKGGVPMKEINVEFQSVVGESIPYWDLGFNSLTDYIKSIKTIKIENNVFGEKILKASGPKIDHMNYLVRKQKSPARIHRPPNNEFAHRRGSRPEDFTRNKKEQYTYSKWFVNERRRNKNQLKAARTIQSRQNRNHQRWQNLGARRNSTFFNNVDESRWILSGSSDEENIYSELERMDSATKMNGYLVTNSTGHQLIGDDFMLQLAIKNLKADAWKPADRAAIRCGLCISGQTIKACRRRLETIEYDSLADRVVILLGAVDIFRGNELEQMVDEMLRLLYVCKTRFGLHPSAITLCTIPPLANLSHNCNARQLTVQYSFNNWIRSVASIAGSTSWGDHWHENSYRLVDLFDRFTDDNFRTQYEYFQMDARMVSGCSFPHVLWNARGRRVTLQMMT